ncbi:MAG: hypothetical protein CMO97_06015 [Woeseia sp.]|nr:hypothetical protein [Woeseia sp.]
MYLNQMNAPYLHGVQEVNENIRLDIARLEAKLDVLISMMNSRNVAATDHEILSEGSHSQLNIAEASLLRRLTTKQHCVAQLVVKGWKNADIGAMMGVSENTIKLHVSATGKKIGLKTRGSIAVAFRDICAKASLGEYEAASGGIPMNWGDNAQIGMTDPLAPLYAPQNK